MDGRHMVFTSALAEKRNCSYASVDVLAAAKAISVPEIVDRIMKARGEGRFTDACALSLDMVIHRIRTVREGYSREKQKAIDRGDTYLVVKLEEEWWGCKPEEEGKHPLRSEAERMIADTLFAIYEKSNGSMDRSQWKKIADAIMEELNLSVNKRIAKSGDATADFVPLTIQELDIVTRIWIAGLELAESRVMDEERKPSGSRATAAS